MARLPWNALAVGLPIVAGIDAHHWLQIGVRHTLVHADELTLRSVFKSVTEGLTGLRRAPILRPRPAAKSLKNMTKLLRKSYGGLAVRPARVARPLDQTSH